LGSSERSIQSAAQLRNGLLRSLRSSHKAEKQVMKQCFEKGPFGDFSMALRRLAAQARFSHKVHRGEAAGIKIRMPL